MKTLLIGCLVAVMVGTLGCAVQTETPDVAADTTIVRDEVVTNDPAPDRIGTTSAASVDLGQVKGSKSAASANKGSEPLPEPWMEPQPEPWAPTKSSTSKASSGTSGSGSGSSQKP